jgi:hypothetical protein
VAWILQHSGARLAFVDLDQLAALAQRIWPRHMAQFQSCRTMHLPWQSPNAATDAAWLHQRTTGRQGCGARARPCTASLAYLSEVLVPRAT